LFCAPAIGWLLEETRCTNNDTLDLQPRQFAQLLLAKKSSKKNESLPCLCPLHTQKITLITNARPNDTIALCIQTLTTEGSDLPSVQT
jgi:hypothetical protein